MSKATEAAQEANIKAAKKPSFKGIFEFRMRCPYTIEADDLKTAQAELAKLAAQDLYVTVTNVKARVESHCEIYPCDQSGFALE
jgi:hypothetical protein